jgi:hypothetical protein
MNEYHTPEESLTFIFLTSNGLKTPIKETAQKSSGNGIVARIQPISPKSRDRKKKIYFLPAE